MRSLKVKTQRKKQNFDSAMKSICYHPRSGIPASDRHCGNEGPFGIRCLLGGYLRREGDKEQGALSAEKGKTIALALKARGWDSFIFKVAVVGSASFGT